MKISLNLGGGYKEVHGDSPCIFLCLKYYRSKILKRTRNAKLRIDENSELLKSV